MERRMRVVGLCLVAVFALSAMIVTASAQAGVEIGACSKVAKSGAKGKNKYKGRYLTKVCSNTAEATPEEQGLGGESNKYEWHPGASGNGNFSAKSKTVKITAGEAEIECKGSVSTAGAVRGSGTVETKLLFKSCKQPKNEKKPCTSRGKSSGEIETELLLGTLTEGAGKEPLITYVAKEKGTIGNAAEPWVKFECIEKLFTVNGSLTGKVTQPTNEMTKKGGFEFAIGIGAQELVAHFPGAFNEEEEEAPATLALEATTKFENSYELRQQ